MFSLGGGELLLVVVVALLLFGPDKIPQMAKTVGRFMREFNKYKDIMESTLRNEIYSEEWSKQADEPDTKSASERIAQAASAVQELVPGDGVADGEDEPEADVAADGETASVAEVPPVDRAPALATDEDEEDEG